MPTTYNKSASRQGSFVTEQVIAPARGAACSSMWNLICDLSWVDEQHLKAATRRLMSRVVISSSGCHVWTGHRSNRGYGKTSIMSKSMLAHRLAYLLANGSIPSGLDLDHLCRNPACINPSHLEPVTNEENIRRAVVSRKKCKRGHPLTDAYVRPYKDGFHRACRQCVRESRARRLDKRRVAVRKAYANETPEQRRARMESRNRYLQKLKAAGLSKLNNGPNGPRRKRETAAYFGV